MNKQALAFLTMFSLVLMLSVYYVTLPADSTTVMREDSTKDKTSSKDAKENAKEKVVKDEKTKNKEVSKQQENTSKEQKVVALQENIDQKKDEEINKNSSVVGDSKSDEAKKKEALATIDELKNEKNTQQEIATALKKDKYDAAVEIKDTTCIVTVFNQKDDKEIAKKVMKKTSDITNNKYFIEVTFK